MNKLAWPFLLLVASLSASAQVSPDQEEWIQLFNGKDLTGWVPKISGYPLNVNAKNTFRVNDGQFKVSYADYEHFNGEYGHIFYKDPYSYYKLRFEYRFTGDQLAGGEKWNVRNSGVMVHSQSAASMDFDQDFPVSIEVQLLGGLNWRSRPTANVCTPGTYVYTNKKPNYKHCINSKSKTYRGDQWVTAEVIVLGDQSIEHIIDGAVVMKYTQPRLGGGFITRKGTEEWATYGVKNPAAWTGRDDEPLGFGYIALQAESHAIDFRKIELLNLEGCMDEKAKNFKSYFVKASNDRCEY